METARIRLTGPGVQGTRVNADLLRDVLTLAIEGSQRAIRVLVEGRSTARGTPPAWLPAATDFVVEIKDGSTVIELTAPTLLEASPQEFAQQRMFPELDPRKTAVQYLAESISAATEQQKSDLYDRSMLQFFGQFETLFDHGIDSLSIEADDASKPVRLVRESMPQFKQLEKAIPPTQYVRVAGKLDLIRHSDRTFYLCTQNDAKIKGVVDSVLVAELQRHWGKDVVVSGTCHFTPAGTVLRIDADTIQTASEKDLQLWALSPEPLFMARPEASYAVPQGPRSGLNAVFGKWPSDESDEEIEAALFDLS